MKDAIGDPEKNICAGFLEQKPDWSEFNRELEEKNWSHWEKITLSESIALRNGKKKSWWELEENEEWV